ncbi:hypothetical protein N9165_03080, partial [Akkermansiaceae bacterium]|nr:hypothetical protein [Akkermansiaceae bacterium]
HLVLRRHCKPEELLTLGQWQFHLDRFFTLFPDREIRRFLNHHSEDDRPLRSKGGFKALPPKANS